MSAIARIPRPFLSTGLAAGALATVMSVCTTTLMAASSLPAAHVIVSLAP